jgi:hypothetical protein
VSARKVKAGWRTVILPVRNIRRENMRKSIKQWIIGAYRRGEPLHEICAQLHDNFDVGLSDREIQDVCDEAGTDMRCVCGYVGDDFIPSEISTWLTVVYVCPRCGTLRMEV